ncbi:MAG: GreA/GreB family elongation factor [Chloroflexota bacterium]
MEIPWPINTVFRIVSQDGEETWTVAAESDPRRGITSYESPLGKSLLFSAGQEMPSFQLPDKSEFTYKILSVKPPGVIENAFASPLDFYLDGYRSDPGGIRLNTYMANICLECGNRSPIEFEGKRVCLNCEIWWYHDHCWRCKDQHVDSRDPRTPRCSKCRYWICAKCDACFCNSAFLWTRDF